MTDPISCRAGGDPWDVRHLGTAQDYLRTWDLQRELATDRADGTGPDTLLLLEHDPVYTAGRRTEPQERPTDDTEVIDTDRGGRITWHGPGQLVGYPIVKLANPIDVVNYVRRLEQGLIAVCDHFGLDAGRVERRSGVWLAATATRPERKIAAIGIRVQREVTMHGFQINCDADLSQFDRIIPCGITDAGVTSLSEEVGRRIGVAEVLPVARDAIIAALDGSLPVSDRPVRRESPTAAGVTFQLAR